MSSRDQSSHRTTDSSHRHSHHRRSSHSHRRRERRKRHGQHSRETSPQRRRHRPEDRHSDRRYDDDRHSDRRHDEDRRSDRRYDEDRRSDRRYDEDRRSDRRYDEDRRSDRRYDEERYSGRRLDEATYYDREYNLERYSDRRYRPRPSTSDDSRRDTEEAGPSWGQGGQQQSRFQSQPQRSSQHWREQDEGAVGGAIGGVGGIGGAGGAGGGGVGVGVGGVGIGGIGGAGGAGGAGAGGAGGGGGGGRGRGGRGRGRGGDGGDFSRRMGGLHVEEEQQAWGRMRREGRGPSTWGQPQFRQELSQPQRPVQLLQQAWPRPPQTQTRPQPPPLLAAVTGAWAKGPPLELQRAASSSQAQEKSKEAIADKPGQAMADKPAQAMADKPAQAMADNAAQAMADKPKEAASEKESQEQTTKPEEAKSKKKERPLPETLQSSDFMDFAPRIYASQKSGRCIDVYANFFPLRLEDYTITVFHYDLVFEPDVPKGLLRRAWNIASEIHFPKRITVFDGMSNVYTNGQLVPGTTFRAEINLYHSDSNRSKDYTMMIKEVRRIPMNALSDYKEKVRRSSAIEARKKVLPLAEVSVIEVILKNWPANNLIQHNRVFFPKAEMQPRTCQLSDRLELRYGYFQSAFLGHKLYLNFDVAHRPFYKGDYVRSLVRDLNQGRISSESEDANHFLKGAKVEYTLPDDRKMKIVYRANKMVGDATSQTFEREGKAMTVAEYFQCEKNFRLRSPHLPLLWVGPTSKTIYLPLELIKLSDDQIYRGALNPGETRKMVSGATTDARKRKEETLMAFSKGRFQDNPYLKEFGIYVSREMETVKARVLEPPKLKTATVVTVKEGAWKTRSFMDAKSFNKWCILNLDKTVDRNSLVNLQKSLQTKAKEFSMTIGEPTIAPLDKGGVVSYVELQRIFSSLKGMTIVIVVIPDTKGLYSKVKTICETQEGILTQCIRGKNITADVRRIMTTLDNLVLKINAKLGGTNHCLNRTSTPPCLEGYVMVVGADVTHAGPGSKIPSVAAVAVCCEVSAFQYGITIRVQNGEIIQDLKDIMRINLLNFANIRKKLPDKIFFFRDGVSEGEMEKVLKTEYRAIREACDGISCGAKITLLVVQKRHHTRFFPISQADEEGKTFNVPVGTCVDSDIVHPGGLDFYLLSHGSLLGTARPTRYRLLHDDNRLTDDELEQLTFYLCHLYARCNRSVSYPSPTYNAHLAAFRARAYLEGLNLTDKDDLKQVQSKLKDAISANYPMFFV